jgi:hypothetical protein
MIKKIDVAIILMLCLILYFIMRGSLSYRTSNGKVYYREYNSGGHFDVEIPEADSRTFKEIATDIGKDAKHVYYRTSTLKNVIPASFRKIGKFYWKDDSKVFLFEIQKYRAYSAGSGFALGNPGDGNNYLVKNADASTFELLEQHPWAMDRTMIYYGHDPLGPRREGFRPINKNWAKDDGNYYFWEKPVPKIHFPTFTVLDEEYAKDKSRVYWGNQIIENCDPKNFKVSRDGFGTDEKYLYVGGRNDGLLTEEQKERFARTKNLVQE